MSDHINLSGSIPSNNQMCAVSDVHPLLIKLVKVIPCFTKKVLIGIGYIHIRELYKILSKCSKINRENIVRNRHKSIRSKFTYAETSNTKEQRAYCQKDFIISFEYSTLDDKKSNNSQHTQNHNNTDYHSRKISQRWIDKLTHIPERDPTLKKIHCEGIEDKQQQYS